MYISVFSGTFEERNIYIKVFLRSMSFGDDIGNIKSIVTFFRGKNVNFRLFSVRVFLPSFT
jgi:hypothetical protein